MWAIIVSCAYFDPSTYLKSHTHFRTCQSVGDFCFLLCVYVPFYHWLNTFFPMQWTYIHIVNLCCSHVYYSSCIFIHKFHLLFYYLLSLLTFAVPLLLLFSFFYASLLYVLFRHFHFELLNGKLYSICKVMTKQQMFSHFYNSFRFCVFIFVSILFWQQI